MAGIVSGKDAKIYIATSAGDLENKGHQLWGISDFSLTFSRDTVEQELVGMPGNYFKIGGLSVEGSYTNCKFAASGAADALKSIVESTYVQISGCVADGSLRWYFASCQITGYDVSIGDADTISEASIDFTVMDPYNVTYSNGYITDTA